jgi:hypothetical protein
MDELERLREWESRALQAQAQAYLRLVELAERSDSGRAARVPRFVVSTFNGALYPFDLFELRALDVALAGLHRRAALREGRPLQASARRGARSRRSDRHLGDR